MDGWVNRWTDGWMDGQSDAWIDGLVKELEDICWLHHDEDMWTRLSWVTWWRYGVGKQRHLVDKRVYVFADQWTIINNGIRNQNGLNLWSKTLGITDRHGSVGISEVPGEFPSSLLVVRLSLMETSPSHLAVVDHGRESTRHPEGRFKRSSSTETSYLISWSLDQSRRWGVASESEWACL